MISILSLSRRYSNAGTACRIRCKGIERLFARMKITVDNSNLADKRLVGLFGRTSELGPVKTPGASGLYGYCRRQEEIDTPTRPVPVVFW